MWFPPRPGSTLPHHKVIYQGLDVWQLTSAWATTVHKSQGGEYPCVVLPLHHLAGERAGRRRRRGGEAGREGAKCLVCEAVQLTPKCSHHSTTTSSTSGWYCPTCRETSPHPPAPLHRRDAGEAAVDHRRHPTGVTARGGGCNVCYRGGTEGVRCYSR